MLLLLQAGLSELWCFPHLTKSYLLQRKTEPIEDMCVSVCVHMDVYTSAYYAHEEVGDMFI